MKSARRRARSFRTLGDLERAARRGVSPAVWGYIQGGAGAERTLAANEAAFARWTIVPKALAGVRRVDLSTSILGARVPAPFFVAPTAYHRQVHPGGERATAAGASSLGTLGVYSTLSSDSLEAIARASPSSPRWFQLYLQPALARSRELVRRAERAGYTAVVVTVDAPVLGSRDRQARSGFALRRAVPIGAGSGFVSPPRGPTWDGGPYALEDSAEITWSAVEQVRRSTSLPLVVKGVLTPVDAARAVEVGASAVVVSNHGGRQLDLAPASLDALPEVVRAVQRKAEVYLDGGVRRGSDIVVALALGARAVGVGRPVLWALAAGGARGVRTYLRLLGTELANSLLLAGCASVRAIRRSTVLPAPPAAGPAGPRRGGYR
jgi:4-hydroxymandelate oxidase